MKNFYRDLSQKLLSGENLVLISITAFKGSSPRGLGAQMLVTETGETLGTIGGGALEYDAVNRGKALLEGGESYQKDYTLKPSETADLGMVCGGDASVYFQYLEAKAPEVWHTAKEMQGAIDQNQNGWLLTDLTRPEAPSWKVITENTPDLEAYDSTLFLPHSTQATLKDHRYFVVPFMHKSRVYIFGGGHVAQALVPVLAPLGFHCTVIDDRRAFANGLVFKEAESCIVADFATIGTQLTITPADYIIIMTRGHQKDYEVEAQMLRTPAAYIGVIGSRKKTKSVNERLMQNDGFTESDLSRVHTPIGKAIKAQTPAEIAISIAAELIEFRATNR